MRTGNVVLLLLFSALGCSGSKPNAPAPTPPKTEPSREDQDRENHAINQRASLRLDAFPELKSPEQLALDVNKVDAYLAKYRGTKAAEEVEKWRAKVGELLEKYHAEDMKAKASPVTVPLTAVLSECKKDPAAADKTYQRQWLIVTGKVSKVSKEAIYNMPASVSSVMFEPPTPRDDVVALTIKLVDKAAPDDALECHVVISTRPDPNTEGKGIAGVKEGDTVTILGRWVLTRDPESPFTWRGPCRLDNCELAK